MNNVPKWFDEHVFNTAPELRSSTLFKFRVRLRLEEEAGPREIEVDMVSALDLEYESLEMIMEDIPAQYAFWAAVYSEARMAVSIAERSMKMAYGSAYEAVTEEFTRKSFKPSAEVVKRIVEKDEGLLRADLEYQRRQMQAGKLYHMLEAIKMKAELARSLAGFKKNEQQTTN